MAHTINYAEKYTGKILDIVTEGLLSAPSLQLM